MDNNQIVALKWPDRIRLRPSLFWGPEAERSKGVIKQLFDVFATEGMLGFSKLMSIKCNSDGSYELKSYDRGLYIGDDREESWDDVFCSIPAGPKFKQRDFIEDDVFSYFEPNHGIQYDENGKLVMAYRPDTNDVGGLAAVQAVTEYMEVTVNRDSKLSIATFKDGCRDGGVAYADSTDGRTYTHIKFKLDNSVLNCVNPDAEYIKSLANMYAKLCPGFECTVEDGAGKISYCYEDEISALEKEISDIRCPAFYREKTAFGRERYNSHKYQATARVGFVFTKNHAAQNFIHNFGLVSVESIHCKRALDSVCSVLRYYLPINENGHRGKIVNDVSTEKVNETMESSDIPLSVLLKSMYFVVDTRCSRNETESRRESYSDWTPLIVENKMIADMIEDIFKDSFANYGYEHKKTLESIMSEILDEYIGEQ